MSNFYRVVWNPKEQAARAAAYLDDHFGRHQYGVKFEGDDKVYRPEEVEIPLEMALVPHSEAAEIIAGFILWHDPAYKPSPSENLPRMIADAKAFLGDRYAIVSNQCGND